MRTWPLRRWVFALVAAGIFLVLVAVPTAMIETPWFSRDLAVTWWAWPGLMLSSLLAGLLLATYVRQPREEPVAGSGRDGAARGGWVAGALTFFAVGCPVCNKLVLVALGYAGAISWFAPVQPYLQLAAILLLLWGLRLRLRGERECRALTA